jgi:hypothetical protein
MQKYKFKNDRLRQFFTFLVDREEVWYNKTVLKKPPPWTDNEILRELFFCNVYREHDAGTQFCINNILKAYGDLRVLLLHVVVYRLFNEPATYEAIKHCVNANGTFEGVKAGKILDKRRGKCKIFRGAWMASGTGITGMTKAMGYCLDIESSSRRLGSITKRLVASTSMEQAWEIVREMKWCGGFCAYQIVLDLNYLPHLHNRWRDANQWVYPGPGAKLGLYWLLGHNPISRSGSGKKYGKGLGEADFAAMIHALRKRQDSYFHQFKLKFRRWEGKPLDVHNIEFSLCEFNKYMRGQYGGKRKRYNNPQLSLLEVASDAIWPVAGAV